MFQVYLLLGANLGKRFDQMRAAFQEVGKQVGSIIHYSALYETAAWGVEDEPNYLNQVLLVETTLEPLVVLKRINKIEKKLGRVRNLKWESRLIDIDILFYDDLIINSSELIVPHPYLHLRRFTLIPLHEIAPDWIHPIFKKNTGELLKELKDELDVRKLDI
jgi:2-amino-4-hydroxy-6-hydroxymethyldihydropteridine diphosphokinase